MTAAPSRPELDRDADALGQAAPFAVQQGATLGAWLDQLERQADDAAPAPLVSPLAAPVDGPSPEPETAIGPPTPPPTADAAPAETSPADGPPAATAAPDLSDQLRELGAAMATAVEGLRQDLSEVFSDLTRADAQTREVVAGALGRLSGRIDRAEALNTEAQAGLQGAVTALEARLRRAEGQLAEVAANRDLALVVEALARRLDRLEAAPAPPVQQDTGQQDFEDLFEQDAPPRPTPRAEERVRPHPHRDVELPPGRLSTLPIARRRIA